MADVSVTVKLDPGWQKKVLNLPPVKDELTNEARKLEAKANALSAGFKSGIWHDPKTRQKKGGTPAVYGMKRAQRFGSAPVAIVYTANYAAKKDNIKNNTLAKVL